MSQLPTPSWKYVGATPGADTTERDLFNTVSAFQGTVGALGLMGIKRLIVQLNTSGAVNLKIYISTDGGTNWTEDTFFASPFSAGVNQRDFPVEQYSNKDLKITATNAAASAQTTYGIGIIGAYDRALAQ